MAPGLQTCPILQGGETTPKGIQTLSGPCLGLTSRGGGTTLQGWGEATAPEGWHPTALDLTELAAGFRAAGDPTPFLLAHFLLWNGMVSRMPVSLSKLGATAGPVSRVRSQRKNQPLSLAHA